MKRCPLPCALLFVAASLPLRAAPATALHVDGAAPRVTVSPSLYGIFFEEINHAGEGGLYAEMILPRPPHPARQYLPVLPPCVRRRPS